MERLAEITGLAVRQDKDYLENLTGFERRNRYDVLGPDGAPLFHADETEGNHWLRWLMKAARPWEINLRAMDGAIGLRVSRPFRFYFHEVEVADGRGAAIGHVRRRFSLLNRVYDVTDTFGRKLFTIVGPVLRPWTFHIRKGGGDLGCISKKWNGLLAETFSDADSFGVAFPADADPRAKALLLGAVFLIDFMHFEDNGGFQVQAGPRYRIGSGI